MRRIVVSLGDRSYPICVGHGLLTSAQMLADLVATPRVLVVTNTVVAPLYLDTVMQALRTPDAESHIIPDGEQHKSLQVMNGIVTRLLELGFGRDSCLVALGGGVVGDVTGFAAASYQRGIRYVQVPTTLLAQVDSAVGGKTAVNHPLGKNMIGAFHQPAGVIADIATLATLPRRELSAGLAEVIKYGLIADADFFSWLEREMDSLLGLNQEPLGYAIEKSCRIKASVVETDERESGLRAILNLGHTFGHAMETALDYKEWLHGEAVAVGMLMATDLSCRVTGLDSAVPERLRHLLRRAGLPVEAPRGIGVERLRQLMSVDKKSRSGRLRLILLGKLGEARIADHVDEEQLNRSISKYLPAGPGR